MRCLMMVVALGAIGIAAGEDAEMRGKAKADERGAEISVGIEQGDIRGSDHRALQAAVDYIAGLGGGTVRVGPGRYTMRNALTLRDNVRVCGVAGQTVLIACDGAKSLLELDGDCNERQITLAEPGAFRVGDGVAVGDKRMGGGFGVTTTTLTAPVGTDGKTFRISTPLYYDYMVANNAWARLAFPLVGGWHVKHAAIEGLTLDGNREKAEPLDGCRGGAIYLFECEHIAIRNCIVRNYNGDGISFQVSENVVVEDCVCENNASLGLHPGSGSQRPIVRRNRSTGNGSDGMFVCWRVKHGVFEKNELVGNKGHGISIGHKDTDNVFRENTITGNGKAGVLFRDESEPMGAHRNVFERNVITDNARDVTKDAERAEILIRGYTNDLVFRNNKIGNSQGGGKPKLGIVIGKHAKGTKAEGNEFVGVAKEVVNEE
jgi:parallel beta-helix repeat protein